MPPCCCYRKKAVSEEMKKYALIGTAGHVDHGKTCLVKALTGTDTDRLEEEKRRGVTIENGFAFLDLPDGTQAGIIDVPGHEKFIKNMLAGAGGIDVAMLVIAADEGVMPQTAEHLEILSLLGIQKGVVVLTKGDVLQKKDGLKEDIQSLVKGTFLEEAPVVLTSAVDGTGIEKLRHLLVEMISANLWEKEFDRNFRLPIDRVFSLKGFGTVVTGTLLDGELDLSVPVMLYPSEKEVKIRQIQVNGISVDHACPGQRVAVNLPGISKEEIARGDVLAKAGSLQKTGMADVQLKLLKSAKRALKSGSRVHLYHGAANLVCKVILYGREILRPGEEDTVQLRMEQETVMKKGDHFVIRFYSPLETIGGGVVLEPNAVKRRKKHLDDGTWPGQVQPGYSEMIAQVSKNVQEGIVQTETELEQPAQEGNKSPASRDVSSAVSLLETCAGKWMFQKLQEIYLQAGFAPPLTQDIKARFSKEKEFSSIFFSMVKQKVLVRFDEKHYIHQEYRKRALDMAVKLYEEKKEIKTGEFRDRLEISRKCAITLLEGFDKERITSIVDGVRMIR